MTNGIEVEDVIVGTGDEAVRGKVAVANVRIFLNHGTEVTSSFGPRIADQSLQARVHRRPANGHRGDARWGSEEASHRPTPSLWRKWSS